MALLYPLDKKIKSAYRDLFHDLKETKSSVYSVGCPYNFCVGEVGSY